MSGGPEVYWTGDVGEDLRVRGRVSPRRDYGSLSQGSWEWGGNGGGWAGSGIRSSKNGSKVRIEWMCSKGLGTNPGQGEVGIGVPV